MFKMWASYLEMKKMDSLDERLEMVETIVKHKTLTIAEKERGIDLIELFYNEHKMIHGSFGLVPNYAERMRERYEYVIQKLYTELPALKNQGEN